MDGEYSPRYPLSPLLILHSKGLLGLIQFLTTVELYYCEDTQERSRGVMYELHVCGIYSGTQLKVYKRE